MSISLILDVEGRGRTYSGENKDSIANDQNGEQNIGKLRGAPKECSKSEGNTSQSSQNEGWFHVCGSDLYEAKLSW